MQPEVDEIESAGKGPGPVSFLEFLNHQLFLLRSVRDRENHMTSGSNHLTHTSRTCSTDRKNGSQTNAANDVHQGMIRPESSAFTHA